MSGSISAMPAIPQYLAAIRDEGAAAQKFVKTSPQTQNTLKSFQAMAPTLQSTQDLLAQPRALGVVLQAYGLSGLSGQKAVVRSLLTQSPTDPTSLAQRSGNPSWKALANAFANWSTSPLATSDGIAKLTKQYEISSFENNAQTQTPGLGNALYFTRNVSATTTLAQIMSDPTLLKVAETVSGFDPLQFGALDYSQQVQLLKPRVDLTQFQSAAGIQRYAQQYLGMLQIHPQASAAPATMLSLYGASGQGSSIVSLFTGRSGSSGASLLSALA